MEETEGLGHPSPECRYAAWFHELDAWTEYWDIYHPETRGRFYFGDGNDEPGLLTKLLPRERRPRVFVAWSQRALGSIGADAFEEEVRVPEIAAAVMEVDALVGRLFGEHFGEASAPGVASDYLEAMLGCATDSLPPATERDAKIPAGDWRKSTAGRHTIDADAMWFAWAFHLEASQIVDGRRSEGARRALQMAGIAIGAAANFAWRGHRWTRAEYRRDESTLGLLRKRGLGWAPDFEAGAAEVRALYRIREWGREEG